MEQIYDSRHSGREVDNVVDAVQTTIPNQLTQIGSNLDELEQKVALIGDDNVLIGSVVRADSSGSRKEEKFDIVAGTEYTVTSSSSSSDTAYFKFYDENDTPIGSTYGVAPGNSLTHVAPDNAVSLGIISYRAINFDITTPGKIRLLKEEIDLKLGDLESEVIYDVSANNANTKFASLSALLSSENLSTLIPIAVRSGGMSIRFVQTSDNKYVQYRLMSDTFNTTPANWQEAADKEALSLLSTPIIGEYNITDYGTKNTSGDTVITTQLNHSVKQKTIDVQSGELFVIFGYGAASYRLWAFIDDNDNILSKAKSGEDTREKGAMIIAPENATKLIISSYIDYIADFALFGNGVIVKLLENAKTFESNIETLEDNVETLDVIINGGSRQIPTDAKFYAKYNTSGDVVTETSPNNNVWQLIVDVQPQQIATIFGYGAGGYRLWAFTDDEGNIISKSNGGVDATITPQVIEVPQGATKLYVSCYVNYVSTLNVSIATKSLENKILGEVNILDGKKLYFIGDSIMIGRPEVPDIKNITLHISNDYHCECVNNALGGSLFLYPWYISNIYSIYYQLTHIPNDADYIVVQGGVNGVNLTDPTQPNYAPMGEISPNFDIAFDKKTQIGCLEAICQYLHEHFAGKRVGFIMTYQIGAYQYWKDKAVLFRQVLDKWSIPMLDWRESGVSLASPNLAAKWGVDTYAFYDNYDESAGYSIDNRVIYDNKVYKAEENIAAPAGAFDVSKWTLISSQRYDNWHCNGLAYKMLAHKTAEWLKTL